VIATDKKSSPNAMAKPVIGRRFNVIALKTPASLYSTGPNLAGQGSGAQFNTPF